jgi:hypothetical protein
MTRIGLFIAGFILAAAPTSTVAVSETFNVTIKDFAPGTLCRDKSGQVINKKLLPHKGMRAIEDPIIGVVHTKVEGIDCYFFTSEVDTETAPETCPSGDIGADLNHLIRGTRGDQKDSGCTAPFF